MASASALIDCDTLQIESISLVIRRAGVRPRIFGLAFLVLRASVSIWHTNTVQNWDGSRPELIRRYGATVVRMPPPASQRKDGGQGEHQGKGGG
jgi:hypothetical protein